MSRAERDQQQMVEYGTRMRKERDEALALLKEIEELVYDNGLWYGDDLREILAKRRER